MVLAPSHPFLLLLLYPHYLAASLARNDGKDDVLRRSNSDSPPTYHLGRSGGVWYAEFLDTYAPCIVGDAIWNEPRVNVMDAVVNKKTRTLDSILTTSNEGFLVVAFANYHDRWTEDYRRAVAAVSVFLAMA